MTASSDPKGAPIAFDGNNLLHRVLKVAQSQIFQVSNWGDTEVAYQIKFVDIVPGADLISQYVTIGEYGAGDGKGVTPISDPVLTC